MAEVFSLGVYRVFRDKGRSVLTSEAYLENHKAAALFVISSIFIRWGIPKERAFKLAEEQLTILETRRQEDAIGTHT